ncbi:MAG TPA: DUF1697 domain-containing protein [Pyrinomonadaceae bacterium]|jgi:uncharacterized protein (DUF1697 family)
MPKYFAFLRAINVGGHTVKMDYLRALFEALGFANVETFIASGNVIFDSPSRSGKSLENKIEAALEQALGYEVITFVRNARKLAACAACEPFAESDAKAVGHTSYVGFLKSIPGDAARKQLMSLANKDHDFHLSNREVYWLSRVSFSDSTISGTVLAKSLGQPTTLRNITTIKRLASKYC